MDYNKIIEDLAKQIDPELLLQVEELIEHMESTAYSEGYSDGERTGYDHGYTEGYDVGVNDAD